MSQTPLKGVRVLDLTNVLAGPYCSYQLLLFGADVIKIEIPGSGDLARQLGADPELNSINLGASFLAQNAGKKSVTLDLKDPIDKETFRTLVVNTDVLLENFRPGVLARLGFSWDELRKLNPKLIYCAISGFGQSGPMSARPAYDQIIQGLAGMMSVTGNDDVAPLRAGYPVCDTIGGLAAAMAISAALVGRSINGEGAFLDVSMLEASISAMGWAVSNYLITGQTPSPMGNDNATAAPSGAFLTKSGMLNIAANRQEQFATLSNLIGRPELLEDPRFRGAEDRKKNRDALNQEVAKGLASKSAIEWEELLSSNGVPAARILTVPEMVELTQLKERGFFTKLPFPGDEKRILTVSGNGVLVDGEPLRAHTPPPLLGQHNLEIIKDH
ncbi:CaiB/BaiF CoA transferase family protein [Acidithrix ferrooxidans]|uniref:Succinyl-CoA:(R)-benzylsuccinate CoA-transferase subunit BbsF n=1 Tax=Acidithrix ferrooxidans TaxID=1280514 RepID=A0A0D8HHU9_9ACTN|nr:CoA transferase [Acidithrix ferrooxidans]KJF17424.1 succinyl-CoA:(R)-benzylsuccinate CoA-transferase subunit BbsF [Acidithrix ferrooxidans]